MMHKVSKSNVVYKMSKSNKPVLFVDPGSKVQFETWDALHGQIKSESEGFTGLDWTKVNPATGPVYVNGAEVNDILSVKIEKIEIEETGVVICGSGMGVMGNMLQGSSLKVIPISNDVAHYSSKIKLPLNKMVGVIGTAPAGEAISCGAPDLHGGNMDCKEVREGATLLLPVNTPGGLLAIGDLHAVMADGEIGVSGLEVSGLVTVTIDLIKNKKLPLPLIENSSHIMTIASDADLDIAVEMAVANMVIYLTTEKSFTPEDATMLISLVGNVKICQVVDPKKTIRVEFPKKYM